jgi:hypothetical protein
MRKTPVVLGVLSIIFGALTATCCLMSGLMVPFFKRVSTLANNVPGQGELQRAQMEAATAAFDSMGGYMTVTSIVLGAMSVALIVIGVALYRRRAWARRATVVWGLVAIALTLINTVYAIGWLHPQQLAAQHAIYAAHGVTPPFEMGRGGTAASTIVGALFYLAYPIVLLALIGRRSASRDFLPAS